MDHDTEDGNLTAIIATLRGGGVVAYPTEAVFGLGCDPLNREATLRLLDLKQRGIAQGLLLIASEFSQVETCIDLQRTPPAALARAQATWPGPNTWVFPARSNVPEWIVGGHAGIAVRITAHERAAALCRAFGGALISTSANRHGAAPAKTASEVALAFGERVDGILNGVVGGLERPTSIRDAISGARLRG